MSAEKKFSTYNHSFVISKNKVRAALPCTGKDKDRPVLGLLCFEHKGGRSILNATDSYRAISIDFTEDDPNTAGDGDFKLCIPATTVKQMIPGTKGGYLRLDFDARNIAAYVADITPKYDRSAYWRINTAYSDDFGSEGISSLVKCCDSNMSFANQWSETNYPDLSRLMVKDPEKISNQLDHPAKMNPAYEIDACKALQSLQKDDKNLYGAWRHFNDNQSIYLIFSPGTRAHSEKMSDGSVVDFPTEPNKVVAEVLVMGLRLPGRCPEEIPESIYGSFDDLLCDEARAARAA